MIISDTESLKEAGVHYGKYYDRRKKDFGRGKYYDHGSCREERDPDPEALLFKGDQRDRGLQSLCCGVNPFNLSANSTTFSTGSPKR